MVSTREILSVRKRNPYSIWHSGASSHVTTDRNHAAARIFDDFANIVPRYTGPKLTKGDAVFAMGSCFAREVEGGLTDRGANVVSVDRELLNRPEFRDGDGNVRSGFFHRFTPGAILQEFQIAFKQVKGWDPKSSLIVNQVGGQVVDLNYWNVEGSDMRLKAHLVRRKIACQLVRRAASADVVILTLGMTEGWIHKPSGFYVNRFFPKLVKADDYEFHVQGYAEIAKNLNLIHRLLSKRQGKPFQLVVTVSPVPLMQTFTDDDIVVANMRSKSTLRAAAAAFAEAHDNVHYFPSYEMVMYSNVEKAWRPDRIHVNRPMVDHIVSRFAGLYYAPGELEEPRQISKAAGETS